MRSPRKFLARLVWTALSLTLAVAASGHAWAQNAPPVINGPATVSAQEGVFFSVTFSALSVDPSRTVIMTGPAPSCGISFSSSPGIGQTTGTLSGTPSYDCAGTYTVTITASDGVSSTSSLVSLTIANTDRAPVVTAPAVQQGCENRLVQFTVSASDPDGDAIVSLLASSSPATTGSTFTSGVGNTSGTFSWTPTFTQAGTYTVTFNATDGALTGSASTVIPIGNGCDRAPTVIAPASATGLAGSLITFTVQAVDPDGQAITSLTASGTAFSAGGTFTAGAGNTSGTFSWTPASGQEGSYLATFTASNSLSGSAATQVVVGDRAPVVTAPATQIIRPLNSGSFVVAASDPDGDAITSLTASSVPATTGSTFTVNASNTSGTFNWTPTLAQEGSYSVTFTASNAVSGSAATTISVCGCDRAPVVTAPATVSSPTFTPITFTVTVAEFDGDGIVSLTAVGSAITAGGTFTAASGNMSGTFAWSPTTAQAGSYSVTFTATDGGSVGLQGTASTQIIVGQTMPARTFTTNSSKMIKLNSGKPQWCAHVEPISGFQLSDILLGSVVLRSPGTGSVSEIPAITGKTNVQGDADNNGIDDGEFCFAKGNLQLLFSNLNGHNSVNVTIAGRLSSGLFFEGTLSVDVNAGGGGNPAASITPNPLNPSGVLTFDTARSGGVRVRIFDSGGRLVRTVLDTALPAGPHEVRFDAKTPSGTALASGVYYFRVEAPGDVMTGRFVVAK